VAHGAYELRANQFFYGRNQKSHLNLRNMKWGIRNFEPHFVTSSSEAIKHFGGKLLPTIGESISENWLMWETDEKKWMEESPIILCIPNQQYFFLANKMDEYAIGVTSVNFSETPNWFGIGDEIPLEWKKNSHPILNSAINQRINEIYFIEHQASFQVIDDRVNPKNVGNEFKTDWGIIGIEIQIGESILTLENGLDKNLIGNRKIEGQDYRRTRVG
jgi:hypothetical protein